MTNPIPALHAAFGGDRYGDTLLCASIGHSPRDRGTSYTYKPSAPGGFLAKVHNGGGLADDLAAKDRALNVLGIRTGTLRHRSVDPAEISRRLEIQARHEREEQIRLKRRRDHAAAIWHTARDPRGTLAERHLNRRALDLTAEVSNTVLRFHQRCPWTEPDGSTVYVPAMIAAMRDIITGEIVGIHRTRFDASGQKMGRKMYGTAAGAAIMLDPPEAVTSGLAIGEGIESVMAARQMGLKPAWALGSIGAIAAFPVLPGIETFTVLAENDPNGASDRGCRQVAARWCAAGRGVDLVRPEHGKDLNDELIHGRDAA